jgi:hypothetical protein
MAPHCLGRLNLFGVWTFEFFFSPLYLAFGLLGFGIWLARFALNQRNFARSAVKNSFGCGVAVLGLCDEGGSLSVRV